jgi:Bacterial Ig-like domain (group 3)/Pentapeptide repeats (9 copies)
MRHLIRTSGLAAAAALLTAGLGLATAGAAQAQPSPIPTTTTLASSANPAAPGASVTYTATVTSPQGGPPGNVTFTDNGTTISGCDLVQVTQNGSSSTAQCTETLGAAGSYTIVASYTSALIFGPEYANSQAQLTETVSSPPIVVHCPCNFNGRDLSGDNFSGDNVSDSNFNMANLTGANLSGADASNSNFNKANLTDANLSGANLDGANFNMANLTGADLEGATVNGSTNFNKATWSDTTCPDGTNSDNDGGTCVNDLGPPITL